MTVARMSEAQHHWPLVYPLQLVTWLPYVFNRRLFSSFFFCTKCSHFNSLFIIRQYRSVTRAQVWIRPEPLVQHWYKLSGWINGFTGLDRSPVGFWPAPFTDYSLPYAKVMETLHLMISKIKFNTSTLACLLACSFDSYHLTEQKKNRQKNSTFFCFILSSFWSAL